MLQSGTSLCPRKLVALKKARTLDVDNRTPSIPPKLLGLLKAISRFSQWRFSLRIICRRPLPRIKKEEVILSLSR